jgi:D-amino-acid dehydrogenase
MRIRFAGEYADRMAKNILIIGGGVIGLSTAYYCARTGHQVTLIDQNGEDRDGCSVHNAGMIVPSHFTPLAAPGMVALGFKWMWNPYSPFYIKPRFDWELMDWGMKFWRASNSEHVRRAAPLLRDLHLASRAEFEELAGLPENDFGLVKKGLLMLCKTAQALEEEAKIAAQARSLGMPADVLDAKQTAMLEPDVRMDVAGAVHFPKDCHLIPEKFLAGLTRQCTQRGVEFCWNTAVNGWRTTGSRISAVVTTTGERTADEFVLCGGAWSPVIARGLGLKIPMQAGKGYSLTLRQPRQLPAICAILTEARIAVTPLGGALRFGGTMEIAGLNEAIHPKRVRGIINAIPNYYPDFRVDDFAGLKPWRGLRPCSPDGLPYLGRPAKFTNLTLATGHAMLGLSLGPITGKIVSGMISNEKGMFDLNLLSPDRYR